MCGLYPPSREIGMIDIFTVSQKTGDPRPFFTIDSRKYFSVLQAYAHIIIEVTPRRGNPIKFPPHPFLVSQNLVQGCRRNHFERTIAMREMKWDPVVTVCPHRTHWTASFPVGAKHEMIDEQLTVPSEKVEQGFGPVVGLKVVLFRKFDPRKGADFGGYRVASMGKILLFLEKVFTSGIPFFAGNDGVIHV